MPTPDGAERARKVRAFRERHADATGARQRRISITLVIAVAIMGFFMTLGGFLTPSVWGVVGGALVASATVPLVKAERSRTESWKPEARPLVIREARWYLLGIAAIAAGIVLTVHPWTG